MHVGKLGDIVMLGAVGVGGYLLYKFIKDPLGIKRFLEAPFAEGSLLRSLFGEQPKTAQEFQEAAAAGVEAGTMLYKLESGEVVKITPTAMAAIEASMPTGAESFAEKVEWYVAPKTYTAEPWTGTIQAMAAPTPTPLTPSVLETTVVASVGGYKLAVH